MYLRIVVQRNCDFKKNMWRIGLNLDVDYYGKIGSGETFVGYFKIGGSWLKSNSCKTMMCSVVILYLCIDYKCWEKNKLQKKKYIPYSCKKGRIKKKKRKIRLMFQWSVKSLIFNLQQNLIKYIHKSCKKCIFHFMIKMYNIK
jgi:hypothetical protein